MLLLLLWYSNSDIQEQEQEQEQKDRNLFELNDEQAVYHFYLYRFTIT